MDDFCIERTEILGLRFHNATMEEAELYLLGLAAVHRPCYVVTPNAEIGYSSLSDAALRDAVNGADFVSPDGAGVVLASRILGRPLKQRVAGFDLFCALLPRMEQQGLRLFLLGSAEGVAEQAANAILRKYPALQIVGIHNGYFKDDAAVIEQLNAARPDFIVVALGSPRQEFWMSRHRAQLKSGVMMGLGGTLDIFAGNDRRAPALFIRLNLEWFYRLLRHPWRLIRMFKLPKYILRAVQVRLFGKKTEKHGQRG